MGCRSRRRLLFVVTAQAGNVGECLPLRTAYLDQKGFLVNESFLESLIELFQAHQPNFSRIELYVPALVVFVTCHA
jgi:hypothetical protein